MANAALRFRDNCEGPFFVDETCIACDTCADIAPENFKLTAHFDHAIVVKQPQTDSERLRCADALSTCPVGAIGQQA